MALTMERFAEMLNAAMTAFDLSPTDLARRTRGDGLGKPMAPDTIRDYLNPDYPPGVPKADVRRRLEQALQVYQFYFEQSWDDVPVEEQRRRVHRGEEPPSARFLVASPEPTISRDTSVSPRSLEEAAAYVVEQFKTFGRANLSLPQEVMLVLGAELEAAMGQAPKDARDDGASGSASQANG